MEGHELTIPPVDWIRAWAGLSYLNSNSNIKFERAMLSALRQPNVHCPRSPACLEMWIAPCTDMT